MYTIERMLLNCMMAIVWIGTILLGVVAFVLFLPIGFVGIIALYGLIIIGSIIEAFCGND